MCGSVCQAGIGSPQGRLYVGVLLQGAMAPCECRQDARHLQEEDVRAVWGVTARKPRAPTQEPGWLAE